MNFFMLLQAGLKTTLRCAGGWVRDKLMGRESLDIDIALDNMMGREFAEKVNEHLKVKVCEPSKEQHPHVHLTWNSPKLMIYPLLPRYTGCADTSCSRHCLKSRTIKAFRDCSHEGSGSLD